ncbi:hypothetical protein ACT3HK_11865 [Thermolongibacillus altinsuensis]
MNILSDHIKQTIRKIDAFIENYTLGTLVIENQTVSLVTEHEEIQLDDSYEIQVFDGLKYHSITLKQALNTFFSDADWHLYAGLEARVKKVA